MWLNIWLGMTFNHGVSVSVTRCTQDQRGVKDTFIFSCLPNLMRNFNSSKSCEKVHSWKTYLPNTRSLSSLWQLDRIDIISANLKTNIMSLFKVLARFVRSVQSYHSFSLSPLTTCTAYLHCNPRMCMLVTIVVFM
jgi:hypothetical protein